MSSDPPVPPPEDDVTPTEALPLAMPAHNWSENQIERLKTEWGQAIRAYAFHPFIQLTALSGDPPGEGTVIYRLRTVVLDPATNELQYADSMAMHVWMPPGYPHQPPLVRPLGPVFHPNMSPEGIHLPWNPSGSLVTMIRQVGEYLAFRNYDPAAVANHEAMNWVLDNTGLMPLDPTADLTPNVGGDPLSRINQFGLGLVEHLQRAANELRDALVAGTEVPPPLELRGFVDSSRTQLAPLLPSEIVETIRKPAQELDDWLRQLPLSVPTWNYLRQLQVATTVAQAAPEKLQGIAEPLVAALDELNGLVTDPISASRDVLGQIPDAAELQARHATLSELLQRVLRQIEPIAVSIDATSLPAPAASGLSGAIATELQSRLTAASEAAAAARDAARPATDALRPATERAKVELGALERVIGWREYANLYQNGLTLEKRVLELGSDGLQAFFIESEAGSFGPFQLEEAIELGAASVAVRSTSAKHIEVIDGTLQTPMGRAAASETVVQLPLAEGQPETYPATFWVSERCVDVLIQLDAARQQASASLKRMFSAPAAVSTSWFGMVLAQLADTETQAQLIKDQRGANDRWKALVADVTALAPFKERLATHNLVQRLLRAVPRLLQSFDKQRQRADESNRKVAEIAAKSSRDFATGQLVVPPKFLGAYTEELDAMERARQRMRRIKTLLDGLASDVRARTSNYRSVGRGDLPAPALLPPPREDTSALAEDLTDDALSAAVTELAGLMRVKFPLQFTAPPASKPAPPPPATAPSAALTEEG